MNFYELNKNGEIMHSPVLTDVTNSKQKKLLLLVQLQATDLTRVQLTLVRGVDIGAMSLAKLVVLVTRNLRLQDVIVHRRVNFVTPAIAHETGHRLEHDLVPNAVDLAILHVVDRDVQLNLYPAILLPVFRVATEQAMHRMHVELRKQTRIVVEHVPAALLARRHTVHHDDMQFDEIEDVLPDVHLHRRVAVDPLGDFRVDIIPRLANLRRNEAPQGLQVFVELLLAPPVVTGVTNPRRANTFALFEVLQTDALLPTLVTLTDRITVQARTLDDDLGHVLTHSILPSFFVLFVCKDLIQRIHDTRHELYKMEVCGTSEPERTKLKWE
jgi:hypothetical protein